MSAAEQPTHETARPGDTLTERDLEMLAMERLWWQFAGAKEQAIREKFDMSSPTVSNVRRRPLFVHWKGNPRRSLCR